MGRRLITVVGLDTDVVDCEVCERMVEEGTARDEGWDFHDDRDVHYCPDCRAKLVRRGMEIVRALVEKQAQEKRQAEIENLEVQIGQRVISRLHGGEWVVADYRQYYSGRVEYQLVQHHVESGLVARSVWASVGEMRGLVNAA